MQLGGHEFLSPSSSAVTSTCFYDEIDEWCEDVKDFSEDFSDATQQRSEDCGTRDWSYTVITDRFRQDADTTGHFKQDMDEPEHAKRICLVCGDTASGLHYGIASCEACKAFFKRTVQGRIDYVCPANGRCEITRKRRKSCQACRFEKCISQGMNPDGIRPDRSKGGRCRVQKCSPPSDINSRLNQSFNVRSDGNQMLYHLLNIEPQKVYASPDLSSADCETKMMVTLSNLADRELVATISWAKQVPGFTKLPLADQMTLLQRMWIDILYLNFAYRSSVHSDDLVFAEDFKVPIGDVMKFGIPPELCSLLQRMARKLASLAVTNEEYVLLKAMVLFNPDIGVIDQHAIESVRHQLFDSMLLHERSRSYRSSRRVGDLLLALPLLTQLVVAAREFWRQAKASGHVSAHRLLSEMVDHMLQL